MEYSSFVKTAVASAIAALGVHAVAAQVAVAENETYTQDISATDASTTVDNKGTIKNNEIVIKGGAFSTTGSIETGLLDVTTTNSPNPVFNGTIVADQFIYRGTGANTYPVSLNADVTSKDLQVIGTVGPAGNQTGFKISKQSTLANVEKVTVDSAQGARTGLQFEDDFRVSSAIELTGEGDARVELLDGARISFDQITASASDAKIQMNGNGSVNIDSLVVTEGKKLNFEVLGQTAGTALPNPVFNLNQITVEDGARLNASVYSDNQADITIAGDLNVTLGANAVVDFGGNKNANWNDKKINITSENINVNVVDSDNHGTLYLSKDGTDLEKTSVTVTAAGSNNTGNAESDLSKLTDVVQMTHKTAYEGNPEEAAQQEDVENAVVAIEANDLYDGAQATIGFNDAGESVLQNVTTTKNANVFGIAEMAAVGLHIWRNEINDMNKRMGELRDSMGEANGVWARVYNGRADFGSQNITNKYTAFQFGYDHQVAHGLWLGGAVSYTDGDNDFANGGGDSSLLAFTAYGSWLLDNGFFLDVTGKVGRMKNTFDISLPGIKSSGDYHTNAFSLSAEAGWRFYPTEIMFVEPQVELMYGRVNRVEYTTSTGVNVDQDAAEALIGRAGFMLGIKCPNDRGNAYIRASVLHDWEGDAEFSFAKTGSDARKIVEELGGTWYEYGIGVNFNATKQTHIYADLEAASGGEVDTDYRINLGVRYAW